MVLIRRATADDIPRVVELAHHFATSPAYQGVLTWNEERMGVLAHAVLVVAGLV